MTMVPMTKQQALKIACELAQKFGFVSRSVVWRHLSFEGIASKYRYWEFLSRAPELAPYKSGLTSNHHLVLSSDYRRALGEGVAVSNRAALYLAHDEYLMELVLYLKTAGVISQYWTEQELKMDRHLALRVLGGDPDKIPDLVFDLSTDRGPIRVAVEVEKTRKSRKRYRMASLGYRRLRGIELLLFGVVDSSLESAIRQEFGDLSAASASRAVGYFNLDEFAYSGLGSELRIRGKVPQLGEFFKRLCGDRWNASAGVRIKIGEKPDNQLSGEAPETVNQEDRNLESIQADKCTPPNPGPLASVPDHPHPTKKGVEVVRKRGPGLGGVR